MSTLPDRKKILIPILFCLMKAANSSAAIAQPKLAIPIVSCNLDDDNRSEAIFDYGSYGVYTWDGDKPEPWACINAVSPDSITVCNLDDDNRSEAIFDYGQYGVWLWDGDNPNPWTQIHSVSPDQIVALELDGDGRSEAIFDYGQYGVYTWDGDKPNPWACINAVSPDSITACNLDDDNRSEAIFDYGQYGVYTWDGDNPNPWTQIHSVSPDQIVAAELDGDNRSEAIFDYGQYGVYNWDGDNPNSWTPIHTVSPEQIVAADIDGDGREEAIFDYGQYGVYTWDGDNPNPWICINAVSPHSIVACNLDDDNRSEAIFDYGQYGVFTWDGDNPDPWIRINNTSPWLIQYENEPNDNFQSASLLQKAFPISGTIYPVGDEDYFRITLTAAEKVIVTLSGVDSNIDARITLYDSNFVEISSAIGGAGASVTLEKELYSIGDYYIRISDNNNGNSSPRPYTVSLSSEAIVFTTSGILTRDETWAGVIHITGDVTVPQGKTLTILPGTTIIFPALQDDRSSGEDTSRTELIINGSLIADGAEGSQITFTSDASTPRKEDWIGMKADMSDPASQLRIRYAVIEYSRYGIRSIFRSSNIRPVISHSIIRHIIYQAIYCKADDRALPIAAVEYNDISDSYTGIECDVYHNAVLGIAISHNTIRDSYIGIYSHVNYYWGWEGSFDLDIIDNQIYNNRYDGIRCVGGGYTPIMTHNAIHDNGENGINSETSLLVLDSFIFNNGKDGIYARLGSTSRINRCNLYNNGRYNIESFAVVQSDIVNARYNWWGTADEQSIRDSIYDHDDNPAFPYFNIYPYTDDGDKAIDLSAGTNIVSVSVRMADMSPSGVFSPLMNPDRLTNNLYKWDPQAQAWEAYTGSDSAFGDIMLGAAYRIDASQSEEIVNSGWMNNADIEILMDIIGRNLFGMPATRDTHIRYIMIRNLATGEDKTLAEAAAAGWIAPSLEWWDASLQMDVAIDLAGDLTGVNLISGRGYWLTTLVSNLVLILPADTPEFLSVAASPEPFSPDEDFINDATTIRVEASEECYPNLNIYDAAGNFVRELFPAPRQDNPAISEAVWDGRNSSGAYVRNGTYTICADPGSELKKLTASVRTNCYPIITNFSASPNPFSPNSDGSDDSVSVEFNISEDAKLSLNVYGASNNLVKNLAADDIKAAGRCVYSWDGKDGAGSVVVEGRYTVVIEAQAAIGGEINSISLNIYVVHVTDIAVLHSGFNPGSGETNAISYTLATDAVMTIRVFDSSDNLVRTLVDSAAQAPGTYSVVWDGKDGGAIVPDGVYYFTIDDSISGTPLTVYDPRGTGGVDISHSIRFNATAFDPVHNAPCVLDYSLPQAALVNIKVRNERFSGPAVKVIEYRTPKSAGSHQSIWDGRNEFGQLVDYRYYTFAIWGYTLMDNAIVVEGKAPAVSDITSADPLTLNPSDNPYSSLPRSSVIAYGLSKDCEVIIKIYDKYNNAVRTLLNAESRNAGANTEIWDCRNDNGILVPDGDYRVDIQAKSGDDYSIVRSASVFVYY